MHLRYTNHRRLQRIKATESDVEEMKLKEIAAEIQVHLKHFENTRQINKVDTVYKTSLYYNASARKAGNFIKVCYVSYQGTSTLNKKDAMKYLEWLDAGNVGTHYREAA